ncbi:maleylpyruvate isomerase family mycothiol-dependent enzyme [Saccharothrix syringae]|uniref:maleylpyruvate isomerase family mycothiol-dependent enzyme n=1 Tax=Saccharothrix syringae TaxID=103733 RepID=UPI000690F11C|nr:maleylpyruvate isomerase family mycothiol-dependent enzyme [Saccharothrix syringae]
MGHSPGPGTPAASRVTPERWAAARAAVREAGERFADLVASAPDPAARATADWTVADTAAHVTGIAWNNTAVVADGAKPFPIPEVRPRMAGATLDTLATDVNPVQLASFTERAPARLADLLRASVAEMLDTTADADPERVHGWLGGSRLSLAGVFAHMANELLVHGHDIARASRRPWHVPDEQAALFVDLFLVDLTRHGYGRLLDDRPVRPDRIAVRFHSNHTAPLVMVLEDGVARVEEPGADVDVHLRFRPSVLNLVLFRRVGRARAAMSGSLVVWGRRPWLLPAFLRKLRMP